MHESKASTYMVLAFQRLQKVQIYIQYLNTYTHKYMWSYNWQNIMKCIFS